ncbi:MAG: hypothetical protein JXA42_23730, partial [Anaerolineales bacterium]|nr:hypothetical protein [Anaerolineales bacterium]
MTGPSILDKMHQSGEPSTWQTEICQWAMPLEKTEVETMPYDWLIGRRRVSAAVAGTPDCVPIYATLTEHARHLYGIPAQIFYTNPDVFVEAQLTVSKYYKLDLPSVHGDVINIEAEALGRRVIYRPRSAPMLEPG